MHVLLSVALVLEISGARRTSDTTFRSPMTAIVCRYAFCNAPSHAPIEIRTDVVETAIAPASATLLLRSFQIPMVHLSIIFM